MKEHGLSHSLFMYKISNLLLLVIYLNEVCLLLVVNIVLGSRALNAAARSVALKAGYCCNNCNLPLAILEACRLDCYSVSVNEVPVYPKKKAIIFFNKVGSWIGEIKRKRFHLHYS